MGLSFRSGFRDLLITSKGIIYHVFISESSVYYWHRCIARIGSPDLELVSWTRRNDHSKMGPRRGGLEPAGHPAGCSLDSDAFNGSGEIIQKVGCIVTVCWNADA